MLISNSLLMLQALCVVYAAPPKGLISSVAANKIGSGVELVVKGEGLQKPRVYPFLNGKMRIVEFDAGMAGNGGKSTVNHGGVNSFNTFWFSAEPPKVRINVRLSKAMDPVLVETDEGWKLGFGTKPAGAAQKMLVAAKVEAPKAEFSLPPLEPAPKKVAAKGSETKPLAGFANSAIDQVSIDFVNTDIVQVLKAIAIQANVNIVTSPDVKGLVTVSLRNVSVDEALRIVTSLGALGYARVGATFIVAPSDKIDGIRRSITGEAPPSQVLPARNDVMLSYMVKGGLAVDLLKSVADDKGKVGNLQLTATPGTSASLQTVVIRGPKEEAQELVRVLEQLDNAEQSTSLTEIYEVKYLDPRALREELISAFPGLRASIVPGPAGNPRLYNPNMQKSQVQEGYTTRPGQTGGTGGSGDAGGGDAGTAGGPQGAALRTATDERATREARGLTQPFQDFEGVAVPMKLVLRGSPELISQAKAYMERIDLMPKQIAIEMRVMELSKEDALRIGLDWSILDSGGIVRLLNIDQRLGAGATTAGTVGAQFRGGHTVLGTLDQAVTSRNLIARPNLLALDGRESEVFIGDVLKYVKSIERNPITGELKILIEEDRIGVRLSVLARAGADGNITLDLRPIVSSLRGYLSVAGGGQIPQISERVTQSSTVMRSGETLALGGLIKDEDRKLKGGIPILKDLPIVGQLFSRTDNVRERTEIVFFLTARVVDDTTRQDAARPKANGGK